MTELQTKEINPTNSTKTDKQNSKPGQIDMSRYAGREDIVSKLGIVIDPTERVEYDTEENTKNIENTEGSQTNIAKVENENTEELSPSEGAKNKGKGIRKSKEQKEFIIEGADAKETALQKFNRLNFEVKEFVRELATSKDIIIEENITPEKLLNDVKSLQLLFQDLVKQEKGSIKQKVSGNNSLPLQADLSKRVLTELQNYSISETTTASQPPKTATSDKVTYELYYANDYNKSKSLTKIAEVEKRLTDIERLVGRADLPEEFPDLQTAIENLHNKLKLFDSSKLDAIKLKMQNVGDQIKDFLNKKEKIPTTVKEGTEKKIEQCYNMMLYWDTIAQQLPIIINRLQSLKVLHEESVMFNETLNQITSEQSQLSELLKSNESTFNELNKNFKENTQSILSNIEALDKRFAALSARIDKIKH